MVLVEKGADEEILAGEKRLSVQVTFVCSASS